MMRKLICLLLTFPTIFFAGFVLAEFLPVLKGPYMGQTRPGSTPQEFTPVILSRSKPEWAFCGVFSPNQREFYYSSFDIGKDVEQIMWMKRADDTWSQPSPAPFNSAENANDSRLSTDGNTLFFRSQRPLPGNVAPEKAFHTWYVTRSGEGWGEPRPLLLGGLARRIGYLGVAQSGALYFGYRGEDQSGGSDLHVSTYQNGAYSTPENLGPVVNNRYSVGDVFVAPDESYLIMAVWGHPESSGESDLYISHRDKDGNWGKAINIGAPINSPDNEGCPTVSPDGKFFFLFRVNLDGQVPRGSTYWVESGIVKNQETHVSRGKKLWVTP